MDFLKDILGISKNHLDGMQAKVTELELEADYIASRDIRHMINQRLVEIRLLLKNGELK